MSLITRLKRETYGADLAFSKNVIQCDDVMKISELKIPHS